MASTLAASVLRLNLFVTDQKQTQLYFEVNEINDMDLWIPFF